ncbi:MAG: AraC family transcriptional regulator [Lachnospiraceae bacterium]
MSFYEAIRDHSDSILYRKRQNDRCPPHYHNSIELIYILEGEMICHSNHKTFVLHAGDVLLSPSYTLHHYETPVASSSIILIIPEMRVPTFYKYMNEYTFTTLYTHFEEGNELLQSFYKLNDALEHTPENHMKLKGILYYILGLLVDNWGVESFQAQKEYNLSKEILVYIDQHFLDDLSIEDTAKLFGYSPNHFLHLFKKKFGFGFNEYINILKAKHASMLLLNHDLSLTEACMNSGFNSLRSFYRNFKKVFGVTPTQYLQDHQIQVPPII